MSEQYILETYNLKKYFPAGNSSVLHAVDGINLRIEKGKTLGVVGEEHVGTHDSATYRANIWTNLF